jgi:hypothetical protein
MINKPGSVGETTLWQTVRGHSEPSPVRSIRENVPQVAKDVALPDGPTNLSPQDVQAPRKSRLFGLF